MIFGIVTYLIPSATLLFRSIGSLSGSETMRNIGLIYLFQDKTTGSEYLKTGRY